MFIKPCAALLSAALSAAPITPVVLDQRPPVTAPASTTCAREYGALPLDAAGQTREDGTFVSVEYVDRALARYARDYRATVDTGFELGGPAADPLHRQGLAQVNRNYFIYLAVILNRFGHYNFDLAYPMYAACLRRHIVAEVEKLPPGGRFDLTPQTIINMFETRRMEIPVPLPTTDAHGAPARIGSDPGTADRQ